jgi:hypothetical protein
LLRRINGRTHGLKVRAPLSLRPFSFPAQWLGKSSQTKGGFTFLKLERDFPAGSIDWRSPEMPRLWRYNLHYFDYLLGGGRSIEDRCRLIDDWIANNSVGAEDAWEPFPVSLRIVNWIKFFLGEGRAHAKAEGLKSLYRQALWLERNIEHHLLANHLFKNAKALLFAGLFFKGQDSDRWRSKGLELLKREIGEQVLRDGGHFERSPMYHSMILEDCLDLLNIHFEGAHDGCKRLKGKPIHHRSITWARGLITIEDRIEGQGTHDIEFRLHLHPDL